MKSPVSYICSIVLSVLLVFASLAAVGSAVAWINLTPEKLCSAAESERLGEKVYSQLEKYYSERYSSTGIPAEVYMDAISVEFLDGVIKDEIENGFYLLGGGYHTEYAVSNDKLDESIERFFSDYADSINYEKDEKYLSKLGATKLSARNIIAEYCDVYKFSALKKHGVLDKLSPVFVRLKQICLIATVSAVIIILLIMLANLRSKKAALFWTGISAFIAGAFIMIPSIYLLASGYFSTFTIKQPQIYTAYTDMFTALTKALLAASIAAAAIGVGLVIVYGVFNRKNKDVAPTNVEAAGQ